LGVLADGDGVVELLGLLVDHEHGPALGPKNWAIFCMMMSRISSSSRVWVRARATS